MFELAILICGATVLVATALWSAIDAGVAAPSIDTRQPVGVPDIDDLELQWKHGRWDGAVAGRAVALHPAADGRPGSVWVEGQARLPPGAELVHPVGRGEPVALGQFTWGRRGARAMGELPDLAAAADPIAAKGWVCRAGASVQIEGVDRDELRTALDCAVALVEAIEAGVEHRSCPPALVRIVDREARRGTGTVEGVPIELHLPTLTGRGWHFVVRATLEPPLPLGTVIEGASTRGLDVELGDLFVDVGARVRAFHPEALRARVARDEVRGPLLALVNEWPGSRVEAGRIVHVVIDDRLDVAAAIDRCVELALALSERVPERGSGR